MGNCLSSPPPPHSSSVSSWKNINAFPVDIPFKLPFPSPTWSPGTGFATGTVDLGGVIVSEITTFKKVWATYEGGPDNQGATFFEPTAIPTGLSLLGYYAQPNNRRLFGCVVVAKQKNEPETPAALKNPTDYALVWSSKSLNLKEDSNGYIWAPIPEDGYQAVGLIVTTTPDKPALAKVMCVRSDLTSQCEPNEWIWGREGKVHSEDFHIFESRPVTEKKQASEVSAGTFMVRSGGGTTFNTPLLFSLKNVGQNDASMPNLEQINTLINSYSPTIYNHPSEKYLPSSVEWFFSNGALLVKKGEESNPLPVDPTGSNLPQGGSNDGLYWIDLPREDVPRDKVMRGDLESANAYFHVKPVLGGTYTDLAIWLFYPFNGGATAKVGPVTVPLGKIGEHVGDWEHVTLRISNFNGSLKEVFFSQHAGGTWVNASNLEYVDGSTRFVGYASLNGHACYPKAGDVLQGSGLIGLRNDAAKSDKIFDTTKNFNIISADYLGVVEPPWLNYAREWGPKITYNIDDEINKVTHLLPGILKKKFISFAKSLPAELLGEEGPTGPKMKNSWDGEEST